MRVEETPVSYLEQWGQAAATLCFACAVLLLPVSVASKFLLGFEGITWIDPTLLFALAAAAALLPAWGSFLAPPLRSLTLSSGLLVALSVLSAISGLALRPTAELYSVLREPIRLALVLCWLLVSAWFLARKPLVALKCALVAVVIALASGIYLHLVAFGLAPMPAAAALYIRLYVLRQSVWFAGHFIPRMGGLFIEAPPFGLFMFSMAAVFASARAAGARATWIRRATLLALAGVALSLATQVLLAACLVAACSLASLRQRRPLLAWPAALVAVMVLGCLALPALHARARHAGELSSVNINGNSVGERTFHLKEGISVLQQQPWAVTFGIGPGRYGEYAADTGLFPATVTMQSSLPELLVEWGLAGLACWIAVALALLVSLSRRHGLQAVGWLLGLIIADSFQANWKAEAAAFAIAALWVLPIMPSETRETRATAPQSAHLPRMGSQWA